LGKKRRNDNANLTQDMLNELNKHTLPGYEHYSHYPPGFGMAAGAHHHHMDPGDEFDLDAGWAGERGYYGGSGGARYKVNFASSISTSKMSSTPAVCATNIMTFFFPSTSFSLSL